MALPKGHIQRIKGADDKIVAFRAVISHPDQQTKSGSPKRLSAQFAIGAGISLAHARRNAEDWLDEVRLSFRQGKGLPTKIRVSLSDASDVWLEKISVESTSGRGKLRTASLDYYEFIVRCYIQEPPQGVLDLGALRISVLDHSLIEAWKDDLIRQVSRSAAQRALMTLKQILRFSIPEFGLAQSPASEVRLGSEKDADGSVPIMLEREHVQAMINIGSDLYENGWTSCAPATRLERSSAFQRKQMMAYFYPFIMLALFSGARTGELLGSKVKDFDFEENTFFVRRTVTRDGQLGPPKTKRGIRVLAIDARAMKYIKARIDALKLERDHLVFASKNGKPLTGSNIYRTWKRFLAIVDDQLSADLSPLILPDGSALTGPYHTRHYHASELLRQDVPLADVSERLGHADTVITQRHYLHVLGDRRRASRNASASFAEIFDGSTGPTQTDHDDEDS
ncbi:site-specific integrase [Qipengyuania gaetbuli]|uniref:tyrosine-type recombinase/integrase n=1 Tax=Qipengyuania gaetbuli TaxID=266952 RepID=UPI001C99061F|nr:site-specific integrase [Qipengyuania gaetbuli]MBY6013586.1 site-specific integrase [Qipengyuania gaetbuli]